MVSALAEYIGLLKKAGDEKAILALKRDGLSAGVNLPPGVTPADLEVALRAKLEPDLTSPF